jgi:hypothetical protein
MVMQLRPHAVAAGRLLRGRQLLARLLMMGLAVLVVASRARQADACDLCAIYTATEVQQSRTGLRLGVAEQFTYFGTTRDDGHVVAGADEEEMSSSITQIVLGYNFSDTIGAQLTVPIIARNFKRFEQGVLTDDDETGFGDLSLVAFYSPFRWVGVDTVVRTTLMAGIKLPSGDSDRLREETAEAEDDTTVPDFPDVPGRGLPGFFTDTANYTGTAVSNHTNHDGSASALHGHDIALGSGSVDGVFGARVFSSWKRLFANGSVQYFARSRGSFNYQYANELLWQIGTGAFLALDDVALGRGYTLNLSALFSGETKGKDNLSGVKLDDTGYTALYLGPATTFTWGESLQVALAGDLPVLQNNTNIQLVPDFRIRAALTWRF